MGRDPRSSENCDAQERTEEKNTASTRRQGRKSMNFFFFWQLCAAYGILVP